MNKLLDKIKKRWGVDSLWQVLLILFIFSITGMTALYVRTFVFNLLGISSDTAMWIKVISWLAIVVPSYQVLFLFYGFVLGQFEFVWRFEKKNLQRISGLWKNKSGS